MMVFPFSNWYRRFKAAADPDLQIRGARSSNPEIRGGGGWFKKNIFSALRASVSSKNKGGPGLPWIRHCQVLPGEGTFWSRMHVAMFWVFDAKKGTRLIATFRAIPNFLFSRFEVCFPYFNLMWLCSSCRMRSSLPRLECLPSHWGNSILCPMPPLIRSDGITQDIMA